MITFALRLATFDDCDAIVALMERAIRQLQADVLSPDQIEASFAGMGLDTQLIEDGTYFCVWEGDILAGCGGWSRRATLYGGNHSAGRNLAPLDPAHEPARVRAMYTDPAYVRRGVATLVISAAETAAANEGFTRLTMAATRAGQPFYMRRGYLIEAEWHDTNGPVPVPLATMTRTLT